MNNKMLHVCFRVGNLDKSLKFYKDVLGLIETRRNDKSEHGFILVYLSDKIGGYELELTYNIGTDSYNVGDGFSHIAIGVGDLEKSHSEHSKLDYDITTLKGLPGNAPNYYFITDPDGYKVEIIRNK